MNANDWRARGALHTVHGHTLFAVDTGAGDSTARDGPTPMLLHGYPTSSHDHYRVLPDLAAHYRVIVHDHLGFDSYGATLRIDAS